MLTAVAAIGLWAASAYVVNRGVKAVRVADEE